MASRPTLHTVAAAANVSIATVSKVVNGIDAGVSEATRLRVQSAIETLDYRPNRLGRGLRTLSNSTIGMAVVDPSPTFLADPFTTNLVAGLANFLSQQGYGLLLQGVKPGQPERSLLFEQSEVDGICVLMGGEDGLRHDYLHQLASLDRPIIAFQEPLDLALPDACFVRQDDRGGAAELARRVLARGAKRVTMFVPEVFWAATGERVAAVRAEMKKAGLALKVVRCDETGIDAIVRAVTAHVDREGLPDAIIGQNDQIALAAMRLLKSRGVLIPHEVAIYGFNGFPFSEFADPSLTTVRSPAYKLGETGGALLLERLRTGSFSVQEKTLPVTFVPGESG